MKKSQVYFGRNLLKEVVRAGMTVTKVYVETKAAYEFARAILPRTVKNDAFEEGIPPELSREAHQGVAFRVNFHLYKDYSIEVLKTHRLIVLCNHIEDVHNLGSIVRCARAFGATALVHEETKSASMTAGAMKSSVGLGFGMTFMKVPTLLPVIRSLRKRNYEIVGLDLDAKAESLYEWKPRLPMALLLGSEGHGIESENREGCDRLIRIPMIDAVDSLNVSHAAALALSWVHRG